MRLIVIIPGAQSCPTENENYKLIQGNCYFFEKSKQDFADAQENCKDKFTPDSGKLIEPTTIESYIEIHATAKAVFGSGWLLTGFKKANNNGKVEYSSTGVESQIQPWDVNDIDGNNKPYLSVQLNDNSFWMDRGETWTGGYSVCERSQKGIKYTQTRGKSVLGSW